MHKKIFKILTVGAALCVTPTIALFAANPQEKSVNYYEAYKERNKTLLERVINYTYNANEDGSIDYWAVGEDGGQSNCVATVYSGGDGSSEVELVRKIDLRKFNRGGFRLEYVPKSSYQDSWWGSEKHTFTRTTPDYFLVGDEKVHFEAYNKGQRMERLENGWTKVFNACGVKESDF